MMFAFLVFACLFMAALAKDVVITVGGNTTSDAGAVFTPQSVTANQGDVVVFNFTQGNHTAIQALFASPCIPAHDVDTTVNGFNSGFRDAGNHSAITILRVPIDNNNTIWFYDANTCAEGGIGGINVNESSWETLDGFARNAIRLNGSEATSPTTTSTKTSQTTTAGTTSQTADNAASRAIIWGTAAAAPLLALALLSLSL